MMKRMLILCLALLGWIYSAFGQATFKIDGFSKQYYGKVYFSDTTEITSDGWVEVYDRVTEKKLIHVDADELSFDLHDGEIKADIAEIPYGEHSVLLHEDYNFDGKKDFAIMDGFNSCYHGPSFQIYLASKNGFVYSDSFTRLAQDYCGMFSVDHENEIISTMVKSGCCWHQFSNYIVENNEPKLVSSYTDDSQNDPIYIEKTEEWDGKKMVETVSTSIELESENIKEYFKFHVDKVNKDIILYNINDRMLYYAITNDKGNVELYYPVDSPYQSPDFRYDKTNGKVSFKNKDAYYTIYDKAGNIGIDITFKGKTHHWKGNPKSRRGSIGKLLKVKLDNVVYR